ncbi:MAG: energy-coupled thiamine transporter ThiT [Clostridia bacterium]|nr:energy-coupled thiamine transporter ThiT [Clostridia bacterium]
MWENLKALWVGEGDDAYLAVGFGELFDLLATIAMCITLAVAVGLVIYAVVIRNRDEETLAKFRKFAVGVIVGYSVGIIAVLGSFKLIGVILEEDINTNFWLVIGIFALVAVGIIVTVTLHKKQIKAYKWVALGFAVAFLIYAIVLLCVIPAKKDKYEPLSTWQMYLFSAVLVALIVFLATFFGKKAEYDVKAITYAAICVSLSFALSYVKFFSFPQGGSITFASLVPLALYSYMFGTRRGVIAGVVYGLLQFVQSPQFYQPMQVLLDYPIAFGAIGLAGMAKDWKLLKGKTIAEFAVGTTIAGLLRFVAHVLSGYYVFSSWNWDPEKFSSLGYSLLYNLITIIPDLAIAVAVGCLILTSKTVRRMVSNIAHVQTAPQNETLNA